MSEEKTLADIREGAITALREAIDNLFCTMTTERLTNKEWPPLKEAREQVDYKFRVLTRVNEVIVESQPK